jgi:hypothetical protein
MNHCLSATGILLSESFPLEGLTLTAPEKFAEARFEKKSSASEPLLARAE